ncbi:MAG TPA: hypothetical protein VLE27_12460 [Thermoanaerobaculia bacterium]|nr:hypothetical protein [Thermoanaerobaculia bacterium]
MADIVIRDLNPDVVERLEDRAKNRGHSLEVEAKAILESAVPTTKLSMTRARQLAAEIRQSFGDLILSDSAELLREDRDR